MAKYNKRYIDKELQNWAKQTDRKPLLLRGARQVGKQLQYGIFRSNLITLQKWISMNGLTYIICLTELIHHKRSANC